MKKTLIVTILLGTISTLNWAQTDLEYKLYEAIAGNNVKEVKRLASEVNVNKKNLGEEIADILTGKEVDIDIRFYDEYTPLMIAAEIGNLHIVEALIEAKADVNAKSKYGITALYSAVVNQHEEIVKVLVREKANVDVDPKNAPSAFDHASKNNDAITSILRKAGANGWTPLMNAAFDGDLEKVQSLIAAKVNLEATENRGTTALAFAVVKGHKAIVDALIAAEANVNVEVGMHTPLIIAAGEGHQEIVKTLIAAKANVNFRNPYTLKSALIFACEKGHKEVVNVLIAAKADVNVKNREGKTPLQIVNRQGNKKLVQILLKAGAIAPKEGLPVFPEIPDWAAKIASSFAKGDVDSFAKYLDEKVLFIENSKWLAPRVGFIDAPVANQWKYNPRVYDTKAKYINKPRMIKTLKNIMSDKNGNFPKLLMWNNYHKNLDFIIATSDNAIFSSDRHKAQIKIANIKKEDALLISSSSKRGYPFMFVIRKINDENKVIMMYLGPINNN
ncbi:ankyrin repeat domain-containing protein [Candidatus Uabimicrobium amorphum]|uniref:Uncharacterized protein n=1 Tax=Uabimicrobium amorphum TaxID=2596890 RepID=A0A5S9II91_UABAM|nr:ankyrin repeat domain-containing protein [Candidatus Uabimicrobium amorphum]BBM82154.1 hypothetical protein UABAM_00497 [Candidatus Uabimicrobium amorphum]